ncbi:MAG TPA: tRNA (adenine-N1)-methyltransferase [Acidimicrobiales bacterium]|nr:tRNA (adenine-N1)-methyltransferase [Acidimicrobiales bacterium]
MSSAELRAGERVMLIDAKDRQYLITLREDAAFHTHAGIVQHNDLIGILEGSLVRGNTERSFLVLRPTLSDVVLKMPRGAQVIYPKDLGTILMQADIGPGMRVLEAGVGSGALSMTMLRAGAIITGYEIREDFAQHAIKNVHEMLGTDVAYDVQIRDVTQGIDEVDLDRIVLDMPEPWDVVRHAEKALRPGGILLCYLPTINQTQLLRETLRQHSFGLEETVEILRRTWHIDGRSVRPDHRMVAHTGFLTSARRLVRRSAPDNVAAPQSQEVPETES